MFLLLLNLSLAASISEDQRTYADQTVQERWTWQDEKTLETLLRKEWFYSDGQRSRLEEYSGGVLNGQIATWDHQGVLETEDHYRAGLLHGSCKTFNGSDDERWVWLQRNYKDGLPHGEQLRRVNAETPELRHNYLDGQLHGSQQAWHSSGEMHYDLYLEKGLLHGEQRIWRRGDLHSSTLMHFEHGRPQGQQRYYNQGEWREESWDQGRWEKVLYWHEEGTIPKDVEVYELKVRPLDQANSGGELKVIEPVRPLYLDTQKLLVSTRRHWPNGNTQEQQDRVGDKRYRRWAENGQLVLDGLGNPTGREGRWTEWRADGTLLKEADWTSKRRGEVRTFDRQGRVREVETWEWERQRWQLFLYEGDHKIAEGDLYPTGAYRWGPWTYYREDGTVRRTEVYGHGPYSGNRSYVVESQAYRKDGSVQCSGDERELICVEPQADGGRLELRVKALHRPRHGIESYQTETFSFEPRETDRSPLSEQALIIPVLDGEGLVTERRRFDPAGKEMWVEQRSRDGILEQISGTGPAGPWQEIYDKQERLIQVIEALPKGESCTAVFEDGRLVSAVLQGADGSVAVMGQGRDANRRVAACPLWSRHPELEAPR